MLKSVCFVALSSANGFGNPLSLFCITLHTTLRNLKLFCGKDLLFPFGSLNLCVQNRWEISGKINWYSFQGLRLWWSFTHIGESINPSLYRNALSVCWCSALLIENIGRSLSQCTNVFWYGHFFKLKKYWNLLLMHYWWYFQGRHWDFTFLICKWSSVLDIVRNWLILCCLTCLVFYSVFFPHPILLSVIRRVWQLNCSGTGCHHGKVKCERE